MSSKPVFQTQYKLFHSLRGAFVRVKKAFSTNPRDLLLRLFLYTLLILFPASLAKRFVIPQSYVSGLLVDYLVPTVYLTEILVLLILVLGKWRRPKNNLFPILLVLFLAALIPSIIVSPVGVVSYIRFAELTLWLLFSFWVSQNINLKKDRKVVCFLGLGVSWVTVLAILQLFLQRSLLGYWFLGEPYLAPSLGGVATGSFLGKELLLPYGTFPHPNVMGGVLSVLAVWMVFHKRWLSAFFSAAGTVISFSQTALISLALGLLALPLANRFAAFAFFGFSDFLSSPSIQRRWDLMVSAWGMIKSAPLTGVGLGNFTRVLPSFGIPEGLTLFIQPVHNIFALAAAESGIAAALAFISIFAFAFMKTIRNKSFILAVALLQLTFLGFFDHYLYTLPQGLFILSLTLGLAFGEDN